jgi:hypothetical protein
MPFPNEHACRVKDPGQYDRFARQKGRGGQPDIILGIKGGKSEAQSFRYPKSRFSADEARASCASKGGRFEAASGNEVAGMESVLANIVEYKVREESFGGRPYLVAPVVMLVEGVHHGSAGRVFYPADELGKFAESWNGIPVAVRHPADENGNVISANDPQVIEEQVIGRVFNAWFDENGSKLKAEIWIDINKANLLSPGVITTLRSGNELEVSTGLWFDRDGGASQWEGENFDTTVRNFRPDHLALLPDSVGACSIDDGCGVRANEEGGDMSDTTGTEGPGKFRSILNSMSSVFGFQVDNDTTTGNSDDLTITWTTTGDNAEAAGDCGCDDPPAEEKPMGNAEKVGALIDNDRTRFGEECRDWLMTLEDEQLDRLSPLDPPPPEEKEETPPPEENEEAPPPPEEKEEPVTLEGYIAKAPPEIATSLRRSVKFDQAAKAKLITALMANKRNPFSKEQLEAKEIDELEQLSKLADIEVDYSGNAGGPPSTANDEEEDQDNPMPAVFDLNKKSA